VLLFCIAPWNARVDVFSPEEKKKKEKKRKREKSSVTLRKKYKRSIIQKCLF